ncbi:MAG TPA: MFS transporter [Actinocrinis sp.]|nr:MFS transporter [Actinocrinis sp.]
MPEEFALAPAQQRRNHTFTFSVLIFGVAAYALLQSMVIPVLPTIQSQLHTTQSTVTWVVTGYLLSASVFTPLLGRVGDMVGKQKVLVFTLLALAVGSLLAALATSITVMIIARIVQGIGGGVLPIAFGIARDEFPAEKVNGAIGNLAALTAVGGGLGLVLAGPIVAHLNYHWLFWIPMVMVTASAGAALFVPASPVRAQGKISWGAAVLLSAWLVALLLAVSEGQTWGWTSVRTLGLTGAAIVLAAVWAAVELRSSSPLVDMQMMRIPTVWTTNLVALLFGVTIYAVMAFLPQFVQTPSSAGYGFGASVTASGLFLLPLTVTMFVGGLASGRMASRFGSKGALVAGSFISAPPLFLLTYGHSAAWEIYVVSAVLGLGVGLAFSAMSALVVEAVEPHQTGVSGGMNANIRTIGGSLGSAVVASVITSGVGAGQLPKDSGYTGGFLVIAIATVLAAAASLLIPAAKARTARAISPSVELGSPTEPIDDETVDVSVAAPSLG